MRLYSLFFVTFLQCPPSQYNIAIPVLSTHYRPINECFIPQYHYVAYGDGLGPSRLVHDAEIATKRGVLHEVYEGAPTSYHMSRTTSSPLMYIVILLISHG